jgi:anti-anti-sigma factor
MNECATVLLVTSDEATAESLCSNLCELHTLCLIYPSAKQALQALEAHEIAIIISDEALEDCTGAEFLQQASKRSPDSMRILHGKGDDPSTFKKALAKGHICAFLEKPFTCERLRECITYALAQWSKVEEKQNLQGLITKQHQRLVQTYEMVQEELKLGARVHDVLLKGEVPVNPAGSEIHAFSSASRNIDGDFFDFFSPCPGCQDLVFGDVMGKGLPAALVGTATKTQLTRYASTNSQSATSHQTGIWEPNLLSPKAIMQNVQSVMAQPLIELSYFVSLFYGRLDIERQVFTYVDCGAPKPLLLRKGAEKTEELVGHNFALGMIAEDRYREVEIPVAAGDLLLFFSDGITEERNPKGELFGPERLSSLLCELQDCTPKEILEGVIKTLRDFSQTVNFEDDVTLIALRCTLELPERPENQTVMRFSSRLDQLPEVRQFVAQQCVKIPGDQELMSQKLQLAVNEAFCNIVEHGYCDEVGEIVVTVERSLSHLEIEIADTSKGFDPLTVSPPNLTGQKDGGYGVHIVKSIADNLSYHRSTIVGGWNRLRIYKNYETRIETMNIKHCEQDGVLVVALDIANLDAKEAPEFKRKLIELVDTESCPRMVVDIGTMQFIDSSGLGSLLSVLRHLNSLGGDLKLAKMTPPVRTMFEIVRMHKLFEIFPSSGDAVTSFNQKDLAQN